MIGKNRQQNAHQHCETGRLRCSREITRHRCGRALVNVRRPEMERHRRDLEGKTHHHQQQCHPDQNRRNLPGPKDCGHFIDLGRAGKAVQQGHAVQGNCRSHRAKQQVFDTSLDGLRIAQDKTSQDIQRDRSGFNGQEQCDEVSRRSHQAHSQRAGQHQHVKLTFLAQTFIINREECGNRRTEQEDQPEDKTGIIQAQHSAEDEHRFRAGPGKNHAQDRHHHQPSGGDPA